MVELLRRLCLWPEALGLVQSIGHSLCLRHDLLS